MSDAPSVEQLAALINFSVDAVVLVDSGGLIQWANPATTAVLGYAPDDLLGLRVRDLVEPQDHEAWSALVSERGRGASFKVYLPAITGESS